tara:strand:- start:1126 stop:1329 length:204 start_codon:yes stop_codon:yes gene_type:complete
MQKKCWLLCQRVLVAKKFSQFASERKMNVLAVLQGVEAPPTKGESSKILEKQRVAAFLSVSAENLVL